MKDKNELPPDDHLTKRESNAIFIAFALIFLLIACGLTWEYALKPLLLLCQQVGC